MGESENVGEIVTILLPVGVSAGLLVEAGDRGISRETLIVKLLSAIVTDDIYAAVLARAARADEHHARLQTQTACDPAIAPIVL